MMMCENILQNYVDWIWFDRWKNPKDRFFSRDFHESNEKASSAVSENISPLWQFQGEITKIELKYGHNITASLDYEKSCIA